MKTFAALSMIGFIYFINPIYSQPIHMWGWIGGDSIKNVTRSYGVQGISNPTNTPGGRAYGATGTTYFGQCELWLFGGEAQSGFAHSLLNDLWKFQPYFGGGEWTWMGGDTLENKPGLYGIMGTPSQSNKPGARKQSVTWDDGSQLWLFGGEGYSTGYGLMNDLWKYNKLTNEWTWMKGSSVAGAAGIYGTPGTGATANTPGARTGSKGVFDNQGNLWLFGGENNGMLHDLWKYNTTTNEWTWMKGDSSRNVLPVYGSRNISSATNDPGGRSGFAMWDGGFNGVSLFGGTVSGSHNRNDLWIYNPSTNEWVWEAGDSTYDNYGTYFAAGQKPGARSFAMGFPSFYGFGTGFLFGGYGSGTSSQGALGDLWEYQGNGSWQCWGDLSMTNEGNYGFKGNFDPATKPGVRLGGCTWAVACGFDINLYIWGGKRNIAGNDYYSDLWSYWAYHTEPLHLLTFTAKLQNKTVHLNWTSENEHSFDHYEVESSSNSIEFAKIGTLKSKGGSEKNAYIYVDPLTPNTKPPTIYYRLKMVDKDGTFIFSKTEKVTLTIDHSLFTLYPNPASTSVQLQFNKPLTGKVNIEVSDATGKVVLKEVTEGNAAFTLSTSRLYPGTYAMKATNGNNEYIQKFVVVK